MSLSRIITATGVALACAACSDPVSRAGSASGPSGSAASSGLQHFVGSLHEHSGFSDGTVGTTPADYFAAGKALGLSFMGSAEHSDNALIPLTVNDACFSAELPACVMPLPSAANPLAPVTKWDLTQQMARAASDERFTAFRGFEWTSDRFGHINVFFSQRDFNAKTTEGYTLSMESFYLWFSLPAMLGGGDDGLLVFNHPGREDLLQTSLPVPDPAYAFNSFGFVESAAERAVGVEVFGKSGDAYDTDNNSPAGGWYPFALDQGWHLGPVGAEDEHGTEWATPARAKTVILSEKNDVTSLREALLARRFYALAQNHNDLRLDFSADGQPMGSRLRKPVGEMVTLSAQLLAGEGRLELVTNGGEVVASGDKSISQRVTVSAEDRWYFVRVTQSGAPVAYSAPIRVRDGA